MYFYLTGNYYKRGKIRKKELFESCKILQIPEQNVQIVNSSLLRDDPNLNWNQEVIADIILNFLETYSIDTVSRHCIAYKIFFFFYLFIEY